MNNLPATIEQINKEPLELRLEVRGSRDIKFQPAMEIKEGWSTGNMSEGGLAIDTVWYAGSGLAGGCIDRAQTVQLRDFLNRCIELWECEIKDNE